MFETASLFLGGSFNPIHYGHLVTAKAVAAAIGSIRIYLIPAWVSPFKQNDERLATAEDRCQMCKLAASHDSLFEVCDLEIKRGGPSFTIETVRELKRQGLSQVNWLIGADQLMSLPKWKEADSLLRETHFVVMRRPGNQIDWSTLPPSYHILKDRIVDAPQVDISATEIRRRIAAGESIDGLTPPAVVQYIHDRGLYRSPT